MDIINRQLSASLSPKTTTKNFISLQLREMIAHSENFIVQIHTVYVGLKTLTHAYSD